MSLLFSDPERIQAIESMYKRRSPLTFLTRFVSDWLRQYKTISDILTSPKHGLLAWGVMAWNSGFYLQLFNIFKTRSMHFECFYGGDSQSLLC